MKRMRRLAAAGLWLFGTTACYRGLDHGPDAGEHAAEPGDGDADDDGDGDDPAAAQCETPQVGASTIRRLTRREYDNTVRDLLGTSRTLGHDFTPEEKVLGFDNTSEAGIVSELLVEQYLDAAEILAQEAVADLGALLPCDPSDGDSCARQFIAEFGRRAYRHPLDDEQIDALFAVYESGRDAQGFAGGIAIVLETMLQSPRFLYRVEIGVVPDDGGPRVLDDWELASRLSYMLWKSMPDDELLDLAEAGTLHDPETLRAQAERMLADEKATASIEDFFVQLLELDTTDGLTRDPERFPAFDDAIFDAMLTEARRFVTHAVLVDDGRWSSLLQSDHAFLNAELASYYGIAAQLGPEHERVSLPDDAKRGGLLTLGALLTRLGKYDATSPVLRGKFVRERLLCQPLPPPPDVDFEPPDIDPNATARERFEEHAKNPSCAGCHQMMDPIGFAFEHYDGAGAWRATEDNGRAIDDRGELFGTDDIDGTFAGVDELAQHLASSEQARRCVVTQWFRYGYGREESAEDACTIDTLASAFGEDGDVRALLVQMTTTPAFTHLLPKEAP